MKKILLSLFAYLLLILVSCGPESDNKYIKYQNIVILSDLSNRTHNVNFPLKDFNEIKNIVSYFRNECVKPGKKIGDNSCISFSSFSKKTNIVVDLASFKEISDKQSFINSTNEYKNSGLDKKLDEFQNLVKDTYRTVTNPGLDLISILIEKIENEDIVKNDKILEDGIDTTFINFDNHIYIFTDGYLEYSLAKKSENNQYYFSTKEINVIRNYCIVNKASVQNALLKNKQFNLPAAVSPNNKFVNLHILETLERDKDVRFQTYKYPKELRDNTILEAVWRKWANDSGFKSFEWKKY